MTPAHEYTRVSLSLRGKWRIDCLRLFISIRSLRSEILTKHKTETEKKNDKIFYLRIPVLDYYGYG